MPGTKIVLTTGDDPDPAPFLFVSAEIKKKIAEKKYVVGGRGAGRQGGRKRGRWREGVKEGEEE